jgi:putative peptide zinc metalloprotease protein
VVQLTSLLFAVADAADGERDLHEVAEAVSDRCGRNITAGNVKYIADEKLRPLGILTLPDGTTPELEKRPPVMALRHRKPLLGERAVNAGAIPFVWLHGPFITGAVLCALAAFDTWLFGFHGIAGGLRSAIYNPGLLLAVLASVVLATLFHEFGHASACRYGGARPGVMGIGLYLVWPAFYCDVTDAYRLNRAGRLRTDLGGVYFNAIFALLAGAVFFATGEEAALLAAFLQHVIVLQQLLPLLRFDGYYVLTDLTGVPDILSRIKPIFRSLVRGRRNVPEVAELKPWVRFVTTVYVVTLIPALALLFTWMVIGAPRIVATVQDSFGLQVDRIEQATGVAEAIVGVIFALALVLPVAAMALSLSRVVKMTGRGLIRWSRGSIVRRLVAFGVAAAAIAAVAYIWWPNGDYEPIRPGERGTIGEQISAVREAPSGRPAFTPAYEQRYAPVPTQRELENARRDRERSEQDPRSERDRASSRGGRRTPGAQGDGDDPEPNDDVLGFETEGDEGDSPGSDSEDFSGIGVEPGGTTTDTTPQTTSPTEPAPAESSPTTTDPAPTTPETAPPATTTETTPAPTTTETTPTESEPPPPTTDTTTTETMPTETAPSPTTETAPTDTAPTTTLP